MYSERFANYHANKEFINCQNPAIMDVNLSKKKGCRIPWTVICPYSAQSVGDVVPRQGPGQIGRHGIPRLVLGSVFQGRTGLF